MWRPHGELVAKAMRPNADGKTEFLRKRGKSNRKNRLKIPRNSHKIVRIYAQSWGMLITMAKLLHAGINILYGGNAYMAAESMARGILFFLKFNV